MILFGNKVIGVIILCCSVTQLCLTLCNPMYYNTPGFPVLYYTPGFARTQIHWVSDAIQPSHSLLPSSPLAFSLSQHHGLFRWVGSSYQVAKVLELQLQHQSFHEYSALISFMIDWFDLLIVEGTLKNLLQHHSSKASNSLVLSLLYGTTLTSVHDYWKNHSFDYMDLCQQNPVSVFCRAERTATAS